MKIDELVPGQPARSAVAPGPVEDGPVPPAPEESDERTRDRVARMVLERGPVTTSELATELQVTAAAVRRHLDVLLGHGLVAVWETSVAGHRGRGRPARRFVVTDVGHSAMSSGYEDLATSALRFLRDVGGSDAVRRFAADKSAELEGRLLPLVAAAGPDPIDRAQALAQALSADGYAASTRPLLVGNITAGVQLCQGHCPVQHAATEFPELCEAETETFSRLLGVHVQRLATLAHGEHVCTTHVPGLPAPAAAQPMERQSE
jgi:predicted ArsR family transcriptional regulator